MPTATERAVNHWIRLALSLAAVLLVAACAPGRRSSAPDQPIGLFTSLPILWQEAGDIRGLLNRDAPEHWALAALRSQGELRALNTLAGNPTPLAGLGLLVLAQPRALLPQENVALDDWVRRGGRVLLFADPLLTADSHFALGDKRRPQDVVLLSPILARWSLRLEFDEAQPRGSRDVPLLGVVLPVNMPGRLALAGRGDRCRVLSQAIAAQCRIGRGAVLIVADAALFEAAQGDADARRDLLRVLVKDARGD